MERVGVLQRMVYAFTGVNKLCAVITLSIMAIFLIGLSNVLTNKERGVFDKDPLKVQPTSRTYYLPTECPVSIKKVPSIAKSPYYPNQGTGNFTNFSATFDSTKFRGFCDTSPRLTAILPVYSAVDNFSRRTAIRDTIGWECQKLNCKIMFIVGFSPIVFMRQILRTEYEKYQDILIVDHVDTYRDLNNKAVEMLDWLLQFCSGPKYVIHFIDDTYINIDYYLEDLKTVNLDQYIYGYVATNAKTAIFRHELQKIYLSPDEYPYEKVPDFPVGNTYAFPNTATKALRCAVSKAIYVWVEDIWLTGHVRKVAGIKAVHTHRNVKLDFHGPYNVSKVRDYLFIHPVSVADYYTLHDIKRKTQH